MYYSTVKKFVDFQNQVYTSTNPTPQKFHWKLMKEHVSNKDWLAQWISL
jgi:hypothetical protein